MPPPGFEDYDAYDWTMHYFLRIAASTAGLVSFILVVHAIQSTV